jgi:hypothetical protein
MGSRVEFLAAADTGAAAPARVFVPAGAVRTEGGGSIVWVVREGRAARTPVEAGPVSGGRREVRSGLGGGETLVVDPPGTLKDGDRVNVRTP